MSMNGNLNAAALSGLLDKMQRAFAIMDNPRSVKADKEQVLDTIRKTGATLGIEVPKYNSAEFSKFKSNQYWQNLMAKRHLRISSNYRSAAA